MKTRKISLPSFGEVKMSTAELMGIKAGNIDDEGHTRSKKYHTQCTGSDTDSRPTDSD